MKKEESFEQRDKLHSFVREYKPIPSYARSVSRKRKNILFHVDKKQSVCVSGDFSTNTKYFLKKRRKIENNSSECKNDTDYISYNLDTKHRRIIRKNKLLELELKNDEEPDKEKKEALNKAFFWRFRKLLNQRYSSKEMVPHKRKPQTTRRIYQTSNSDTDTDFSNNTQFENISSDDSVEAVSALNTNVSTINCACSNKPCTLKARLLASTSNTNNITSNQSLSKPTPTVSSVNNTNTIRKQPSNMENNIERVKAIESDVISCLTNLKNFVNAEVAQLNDTFAKIPLPSSSTANPQQPVNNEPQIPPYNINIVNPNIRQLPAQNILYQKYMQNKEELTKNIRVLLEQKHKKFNEFIHERNACIAEMQHSERNKDYFKLEWLRTRLQYLDHSIEKIKNDCQYEANEVNKFTFEQYLNMLERCKHQEMQHLTDAERYNLRQEQLKFFSNDALVEGNRVLEYPFAGIITNTNTNTNEQPRQQTLPPIPPYLMQNHTIVREQTHPNNNQHPSSNSINSQNRHPPPHSTRNLPNTTVHQFHRPPVLQVRPNENYPILPQMPQPPDTSKKQKSRPTIISSTPKRNLPKILSNTVIRKSTASTAPSKEQVITENTPKPVQPQLSAQGNPLRPKPPLLPVGVIRKLNEVIIIPDSPVEKTQKDLPPNEEIPNKRIKLNTTYSSETEPPKQDEKVDTKPENKEETKRKTHLRLQFSLVSNKTITLSYLLKMINQNLNNAAFSNFILKPKNIEELCNIIRKREIFAKIEENSSCQYPNVLTIMNHFLIYVIVCVQIENKINYKELYLKLIRGKEPLRYDYHDAPDQISLEDIDMYLQKAALALHEAIILNSTDKNMKNNKCICSKIKTVTTSSQNTEENDSNYFIKAHGETEISIIVLYEPKLKTATKTAKKFKQKCGDESSTPENTNKDVKQNTSENNEENTQVIHNPTITNLNLKLSTLKHTLFNFDTNKNITFNFDITKMGLKSLEKILQTSENQKIVSEIFEHNLSHKTKQITNGPTSENRETKELKEKTEPVRKRRISLSETSSAEPSLKNKRIQALDLSIKPDFAKINNYKVINVDEKLKPSIHETIINYWKNTDKKNQSNHKTNNTNNNNIKEKKIRTVIESTLEISNKKYYDNPKLKLNINKNNEFVQKTPLNLSKNMTHADTGNKSKKSHFLSENSRKFCINFNTLVYINEIDYQIILEILNEVAKPLYTFYKFVNTIRCKNNQPLINFTAFFFGLKFKKLQKYKKMFEEMHQK